MRKQDLRGGERVRVAERWARVVKCERTHDKAAKRGRRIYLIRFEDDGSEGRVTRAQIEKQT